MSAYAFMLLALTTTVIVVAGAWVVSRGKRMLEETPAERAGAQEKFLADNWDLVERTARENGMTEEELGEVRRKVFAAESADRP